MNNRTIRCSVVGALVCAAALPAFAQAPAEVTLTRFDCSSSAGPADIGRFSDTMAYEGKKLQLTASCYLIRHADHYMIWDTGYPAAAPGATPAGPTVKVTLLEQLAQLKIKPEQIDYVGISHYHGDHTGQAASFPQATLLIGQGDWDAEGPDAVGYDKCGAASSTGSTARAKRSRSTEGQRRVRRRHRRVAQTARPHARPSQPAGEVAGKGSVLLTGDLAHFRENYESNGVPTFNFNRAATLASIDRFKQIVENLNATVVIQHDPRDIDKLPAFPPPRSNARDPDSAALRRRINFAAAAHAAAGARHRAHRSGAAARDARIDRRSQARAHSHCAARRRARRRRSHLIPVDAGARRSRSVARRGVRRAGPPRRRHWLQARGGGNAGRARQRLHRARPRSRRRPRSRGAAVRAHGIPAPPAGAWVRML